MTELQLKFFRELCAPFGKDDCFSKTVSGRVLTYVKAPTLMNRLDDVVGPASWTAEYRPTERGFVCRLGIRVPTEEEGISAWLYKEDVGGFEGMTKKVGQEVVADEDNDEKSGATNSFRRACYAWGLARDLWKAGIPQYLGREEYIPDVPPPRPLREAPAPRDEAPARRQNDRDDRRPARDDAPRRGGDDRGDRPQYDNFKIPPVGKATYAWLRGLEKEFGDGVVKFADAVAKKMKAPYKTIDWNEEEVESIAWAVIDELKTWDSYRDQFDHLEDPREDPR